MGSPSRSGVQVAFPGAQWDLAVGVEGRESQCGPQVRAPLSSLLISKLLLCHVRRNQTSRAPTQVSTQRWTDVMITAAAVERSTQKI